MSSLPGDLPCPFCGKTSLRFDIIEVGREDNKYKCENWSCGAEFEIIQPPTP